MATQYNTITTDKEFAKVAGQFKEGQGKANERLQALIEYGLSKYAANGDASNLSKALTIAIDVKSLPTKAIKEYIQDHANVSWKKTTDGTMKFMKASKAAPVEVKDVTNPFWDSSRVKKVQAKPDFIDPIATIKAAFVQLAKAKEEGKIPADRVGYFDDMKSRLDDIMNNVPSLSKAELAALKA